MKALTISALPALQRVRTATARDSGAPERSSSHAGQSILSGLHPLQVCMARVPGVTCYCV